jgi:hypothetical protein
MVVVNIFGVQKSRSLTASRAHQSTVPSVQSVPNVSKQRHCCELLGLLHTRHVATPGRAGGVTLAQPTTLNGNLVLNPRQNRGNTEAMMSVPNTAEALEKLLASFAACHSMSLVNDTRCWVLSCGVSFRNKPQPLNLK